MTRNPYLRQNLSINLPLFFYNNLKFYQKPRKMPYENFKSKNHLAAKIAANARKFGVQTLQNEELVNILLRAEKLEISAERREAAERIFKGLMNIEESVQLSG